MVEGVWGGLREVSKHNFREDFSASRSYPSCFKDNNDYNKMLFFLLTQKYWYPCLVQSLNKITNDIVYWNPGRHRRTKSNGQSSFASLSLWQRKLCIFYLSMKTPRKCFIGQTSRINIIIMFNQTQNVKFWGFK